MSFNLVIQLLRSIDEYKSRVNEKTAVLQLWHTADKTLNERFSALVSESNEFHDALKNKYLEARNCSSSLRLLANSNDGSLTIESGREPTESACPDGCQAELFEQVLQLREQRIRHEDDLVTIQKELEDVVQTHHRLSRDADEAESSLIEALNKMRTFQVEKQRALSKIPVVIPLTSKQIHLWDKREKPVESTEQTGCNLMHDKIATVAPMTESVIVSIKDLLRIRVRLRELASELEEDKARYQNMLKEKKQLEESQKAKEKAIKDECSRCEDLQFLKFGNLIDIDKLDNRSLSVSDDDLTVSSDMLVATRRAEKEVATLEEGIFSLKKQYADVTVRNTDILKQIAKLSEEQMSLDHFISSAQKGKKEHTVSMGGMECFTMDLKRLEAQSRSQDDEILKLKQEIRLLKRKDGELVIKYVSQMFSPF